jgi:hypothetical protein
MHDFKTTMEEEEDDEGGGGYKQLDKCLITIV